MLGHIKESENRHFKIIVSLLLFLDVINGVDRAEITAVAHEPIRFLPLKATPLYVKIHQ